MANKYHTSEVDKVFESGWQWVADESHPKNKEIGFYNSMLSDAAYGWYTKEGHPQKSLVEGDSRRRWEAARIVLEVWS